MREIGVEHILLVITNSGGNFKKARESQKLEHQLGHCVAVCIYLMMLMVEKLLVKEVKRDN